MQLNSGTLRVTIGIRKELWTYIKINRLSILLGSTKHVSWDTRSHVQWLRSPTGIYERFMTETVPTSSCSDK